MDTNTGDDETNAPPEQDDDGMLDRSKLDFDPADNYFSGSVVDGTTEIPGPHAFDDKNKGDNTATDTGTDAGDSGGDDADGEPDE